MANVATLTAKMVMDVSGFKPGANTVIGDLNKIKGAAKDTSAGFGKMFGAVTAGALASSAALGTMRLSVRGIGMALNEVGRGFKLAAAAETAESGFKVMLGSAEKAKAMMKDLAAFTLATPFSTEGTHDVANTLLGVGVSESKLIPNMVMLGNIASGNTEKLKGLAVVYGQVQSKGKLLAQDFNQIAERGINMRQVLANEVGVSVKDLAKTMEAGKITFTDFHNALVELSQTKYKGMLDEKNKTMQGAIDRLSEVRDSFSRDVAMGVGQKFGLTGTAGDLANFAEGISAKVLPEFVGGIGAATDGLFVLTDNLRGLTAVVQHMTFTESGLNPVSSAIGAAADIAAGRNPFGGVSEGLGKMDTRRDVLKYLDEVKRAGAEAVKNKPPLPEAKRIVDPLAEGLKGFNRLFNQSGASGAMRTASNIFEDIGFAGGRVASRFNPRSDPMQERQPTGALQVGSSEAFSAIIRSMTGKDKSKEELEELKAIKGGVAAAATAIVKAIEGGMGGVVNAFAG